MYSKITQRRWLGIRRPARDLLNDPGVYGEVTMMSSDGHLRLDVTPHGNTRSDAKLLPSLWDAVCVGKGPWDEMWRGYQKAKLPHGLGYTTVIQEWHIEHIDMRPPQESTRRRSYNPHKVLGAEVNEQEPSGGAEVPPAP
jgi:hypothetical protein